MFNDAVLTEEDILMLMNTPARRSKSIWIDSRMDVHSGPVPASMCGKFETTTYRTRRYMTDQGVIAYTPKGIV